MRDLAGGLPDSEGERAPQDVSLSQHWTDDRQLETLIGELEGLARGPANKNRKRDPEPIDGVLSDIIALTYSSAQAVLEPSRMAALEL
jgi:hypothetical protein